MKMDFLFAPLPDTNFQMTDGQLLLWQRNAVFECECDNFINRRIETVRRDSYTHLPNRLRRPMVEQTGIDAAICQHGLNSRINNVDVFPPPPQQRARLAASTSVQEGVNALDTFYQEAIAVAIRERGLGVRRNP